MTACRVLQLLADAAARPELACDVPALLRSRIGDAASLRRALGLPSDRTSAYRLCNRSAAGPNNDSNSESFTVARSLSSLRCVIGTPAVNQCSHELMWLLV